MTKVLKFEATLTIEHDGIFIGDTDQSRMWFWDQVAEHSGLMVGGELGDVVGEFTAIKVADDPR